MTDKKKQYDIVHKGVCSYPQTENFVAVKQFLIINEDGKRYLLVKLTNNRAENVTGATLFVEQFNDRGDKIAADSVYVGDFDGYPQKSFAVEQKIPVASTCIDCRIAVTEAEFGKYTYKAEDVSGRPGYRFETGVEPEKKVPAEILEKAGKKGVTVEPRSLKMPLLILFISIIVLVAAFVAILVYTNSFVANEDRFLHDGVYYSFVGGDRSDGSDVYVVGVRGSRSEISVPAEIEGHNVVRVDAGAFLGNKYIKKVSFGGEIAIGDRAFYSCTALESIDLKNATEIAAYAFSGCSKLRSVELEKVYSIGDGAFNRCVSLTSLKIADGGEDIVIGNVAFSNCESLSTVDISRTIVYGENYTLFDNCLSVTSLHLKNFECGEGERNITVLFGGTPALSSIIIDNIDTVGAGLCEGLSTVATVRFNDVSTSHIGDRAFKNCEKLAEVIMPARVTSVGDEAFVGTAITSFDGSGLELLGDNAFSDCKKLATFTMDKDTKLTAIGKAAFMNCESLKSVTIPTHVVEIGEQAFSGCKTLASVLFDDDSEIFSIAQSTFENCQNLSVINIPETVFRISERAFAGCASLSYIEFGELYSVGAEAFSGSGLIEIKLPASVTEIGQGAFSACEKLQSLSVPFVGGSRDSNLFLPYIFGAKSVDDSAAVVPASLKVVTVTDSNVAPNNAFYGCTGITSVVYDDGLIFVGDNAFRDCSALTRIELADGLESLGVRAFSDCTALVQITLPDTLTSIGRNAFSGCTSLETLTTPFVGASRSSNGFLAYMFGGETNEDWDQVPASLKKVELTDTQTVAAGAFVGTSISEVVLGNSTTAIEENAFKGNRKLNVVTLPSGLTSIGDDAFYGCYFLYEVYNYSGLYLTAGETGYGYVAYYALKIHGVEEPRLTVSGYNGYDFVQSDNKWYLVRYPDGEADLVLPAAVDTEECSFTEYVIHDRLFIDDMVVTSVYIPSNAKSIGAEAFFGCENLTAVTVENGVTDIGRGAFAGCSSLTAFSFPSGVTTVAEDMFNGCVALKEVDMPLTIDRIGENAFYGCAALKEIIIPAGCVAIGDGAFGGCTSLTKAEIPNSCNDIGDGAFGGCVMLYDVNIPSACKTIGDDAFVDCRRIKSVTLPESLERIGNNSFVGCFKLYEVYNLSSYVIPLGTTNYGSVAKYAYAVHDNANDSPIDNTIINGLHYYKLNGEWCLVDYYGTDGNIEIDGFMSGTEQVDEITVIDYAFQYYDTIRSVKIGEQVSSIGSFAFNGCGALKALKISASKLVINGGAFAECENLNSLVVLSGDVDFGAESFNECGLTSVSLTGGDFVIMDNAFFYNDGLDKLTVDCKSLAVYEMAFFDALNEADIKCTGSFTAEYMAFYGSLLSKLKVRADDIVILDLNFFGGDIKEVDIIGNKSVYLASTAFNACGGLRSLSISGEVVDIDSSAFNDCADIYTSTGIGDLSITGEQINISESAFLSCAVESLTISGNEIALAAQMFSSSEIGKLDIACSGNNITIGRLLDSSTVSELAVRGKKVEISEGAFSMQGRLASLDIVAEDLTVADYAFLNQYELKTVTLAANKSAEIGNEAFSVCGKLEKLVLPAALKTINKNAFGDCAALVELDIPSGVTKIDEYAFYNCVSLERLTLPNRLVSIGNNAFQNCRALVSLTIPNTVESIGECAFMYCSSLGSLVLSSALKEVGDLTFYGCEKLTGINLPAKLTRVGQYAFNGCRAIKSLTVPNSVTKIDEYAFAGCSAMEVLNISGAPELGEGAFSGCSALKTLTVPNGVTSIPNNAFNSCYSLTDITIPNSVASIGNGAFGGCWALTTLAIPDSVTEIGAYAFSDCEGLLSLTLSNNLEIINNGSFNGCSSLTELTLPGGIKTIGSNAFSDCAALTKLVLPGSLTAIGDGAFSGCAKLQYVELPSSLGAIGNNAFYGAISLFAVCNKSSLINIEAGSDSYGGVAKYAAIVTADPVKAELTYVTSGKNNFVKADGVWYLYECEIDASGKGLPESVTTTEGVINSYVIKSGTFDKQMSMLIIPKSVSYIQSDAFEIGVNIVFYRGTAEEWGSIFEDTFYNYAYYYVDCVHGYNEWTEIDGGISTAITMSAWKIVKEATCTEKGKRERHCDRCGSKEEQDIPINPFAHDYDEDGECKYCGVTTHDDEYEIDTHTDNEDGEQSIDD